MIFSSGITVEVGRALCVFECVSELEFSQETTTESCDTRSLQTSFHFGNVNNNKKTIIGKKSEEEDQREIITIQIPAFFFFAPGYCCSVDDDEFEDE